MGGSSKGGGGQAYSGPTEAELAARRAEERAEILKEVGYKMNPKTGKLTKTKRS